MPNNTAFANALLVALQRQRNAAQDLCAKAEANNAVFEADNARLAAENAELREKAKSLLEPDPEPDPEPDGR